MLALSKVTLLRDGRTVLRDIDFTLAPGEVVGLLGANGAGKSAMLAVLAGELGPTAGCVSLDGQALRSVSPREQARRRALLTQQSAMPFDLRVSEVVSMGAYPHREMSGRAVDQCVAQAMADSQIEDLAARRYGDLSGGEQQRVQLARVLVQCLGQRRAGESRFLLLDEPTSNQDPAHQQQILAMAGRLAHEHGLGVLVVLHDINLAARWCDRIALLAATRLVAEGTPECALTEANLRQVFAIDTVVTPHPLHAGRVLVMLRD